MNIVVVITRSDLAGAQKHVYSLVKGLQEKHRFCVITGEFGYLTDALTELGIQVIVEPTLKRQISLLKDVQCLMRLRQHFNCIKPDLIHAHSSKAGVIARVVAYQLSIPTIYTAHGWPFAKGNTDTKVFFTKWIEYFLACITSYIITVSGYDEMLAAKLGIGRRSRLVTILNGVENRETNEVRVSTPNSTVKKIVSLTRFAPQKNLGCLIDALKQVKNDFHAVIAGTGPKFNEIRDYVYSLNLEKQIHMPGNISSGSQLLDDCQIYVMSSNYEGLPLACIEALRAGLPIVCTDVGGMKELVFEGVNGYLVARGDASQLALRLEELLENDALCRKMGEASRRLYEKHFTLDTMILKTNQIYQDCGAPGGSQ